MIITLVEDYRKDQVDIVNEVYYLPHSTFKMQMLHVRVLNIEEIAVAAPLDRHAGFYYLVTSIRNIGKFTHFQPCFPEQLPGISELVVHPCVLSHMVNIR